MADLIMNVTPAHPMTAEEIKQSVERAIYLNHLAYVLADVSNSFFMDASSIFESLGTPYKQSEKHKYNNMVKTTKTAMYATKELAKYIYHESIVDVSSYDSDWFYNLVKLVVDRISTDKIKTHMLLEFLDTMPSFGTFKVGLSTFQKLDN